MTPGVFRATRHGGGRSFQCIGSSDRVSDPREKYMGHAHENRPVLSAIGSTLTLLVYKPLDQIWHRHYRPGMQSPPAKRRYNRPLQVRVTPAQYAQFTRAAKASGLTLSAWARTRLIQMARRDLREAER